MTQLKSRVIFLVGGILQADHDLHLRIFLKLSCKQTVFFRRPEQHEILGDPVLRSLMQPILQDGTPVRLGPWAPGRRESAERQGAIISLC